MAGIITVKVKKGWERTERFFHRTLSRKYMDVLRSYADRGLEALRAATPTDSGETAAAWNYRIENGDGITRLYFTNDHIENGINVAVLLIYGHGTRNGGYVEGNDFVSPALRPIFEDLADAIFREITRD